METRQGTRLSSTHQERPDRTRPGPHHWKQIRSQIRPSAGFVGWHCTKWRFGLLHPQSQRHCWRRTSQRSVYPPDNRLLLVHPANHWLCCSAPPECKVGGTAGRKGNEVVGLSTHLINKSFADPLSHTTHSVSCQRCNQGLCSPYENPWCLGLATAPRKMLTLDSGMFLSCNFLAQFRVTLYTVEYRQFREPFLMGIGRFDRNIRHRSRKIRPRSSALHSRFIVRVRL